MYGTNFKSEKILYRGLYPKIAISEIGKRLGVSTPTLYRRFDHYKIRRGHSPGGCNNSPGIKTKQLLAIPASELIEMTVKQIADNTKVSISHCKNILKKYGLVYKYDKKQQNRNIYFGLSDSELVEMTRMHIVKHCGCSYSTLENWQKKYKRPFRRMRRINIGSDNGK